MSQSCALPLEQIQVPTLVVHGTRDRLVSYEQHAKEFETRISGARLLSIEDGEHVSIFTHRSQVQPAVIQFLHTHLPRETEK